MFLNKILRKVKIVLSIFWARCRIIKFKLLSLNKAYGNYTCIQPVQLMGVGTIEFDNVFFGVEQSPNFFSSYGYLEARKNTSKIIIGNNTFINNNVYICAERTTIKIGCDCLIGVNFSCIDSDFHGIHPSIRRGGHQVCKSIVIGDNVFIGNNVIILKGVTIGKNSVIASNAVVTKSFCDNVIIAGNPARVIKEFDSEP